MADIDKCLKLFKEIFKEVNSLDMEINAEIECYISTIKEP